MATIDSHSASEKVYRALRSAILARNHLPGDVLSRPALAKTYQTSQTPVREALLRLERDGFVRVKPQAGTRVAPIDVTAVHQAQFLRRSLEENVVRRYAARGPVSLTELRDLARRETPPQAAVDMDRRFHARLFADMGMEALFHAVAPLLTPLDRCAALRTVTEDDVARARREHEDIVGRIEAGDPDGAVAAMAAHLASELEDFAALQAAYPEMFASAE